MKSWLKDLCKPLFSEEYAEITSLRDQLDECRVTPPTIETVTEVETKEVIKEVPIIPREFPSEVVMRNWFRSCPVRLNKYQKTTYDCDDFARDTQALALADGWLVNLQVDEDGDYCEGHPHFLCNVFVGNWAIIMEPQTGKEVGRLRID